MVLIPVSPIEKRALKASKEGLEASKLALKKLGLNQTSLVLVKATCAAEGTLRRFWRRIPIQAQTFILICGALGLDWEQIVDVDFNLPLPRRIDWGEAPDIDTSGFYGRTEKLTEIQKCLLIQPCRLVALLGLGGIGKTAFAVRLVERILDKFEYVIWRSLNNAPPIQMLLADMNRFLSEGQENDGNISQLITSYFRSHKCLIILDDWEAIMSGGTLGGKYRDGYEDYGELLRRVGEVSHQSCLLLLSREKPADIDREPNNSIFIEKLRGLPNEDAKKILTENNILGTENDLEELIRRYKGNPLALKIICSNIKTLFNGNINYFLKTTKVFLPDPILSILDEQLSRLSNTEEKVIYWLAVRRNSASFLQLQQDIKLPVSTNDIMNALLSLIERRSLVDIPKEEEETVVYKLDPVILKYITNQFIEKICEEILEVSESKMVENLDLCKSHALITSSEGDDSIRDEQVRMIVKPITEKLCAEFRNIKKTNDKLIEILSLLEDSSLMKGYACSNILALISAMAAK